MSFIPSFLKSIPQELSFSGASVAVPAEQVITEVDLDYAVILFLGAEGAEGGGFINGANHNYLDFSDSTHVRATTAVDVSAGAHINHALVLEFVSAHMRQPVYWNTIGLGLFQTSTTLNTGLTLGDKAFLVPAGFTSDYNDAASLNEGAHIIGLSLDRGTGIVTISRSFSGAVIHHSFFIVDPR